MHLKQHAQLPDCPGCVGTSSTRTSWTYQGDRRHHADGPGTTSDVCQQATRRTRLGIRCRPSGSTKVFATKTVPRLGYPPCARRRLVLDKMLMMLVGLAGVHFWSFCHRPINLSHTMALTHCSHPCTTPITRPVLPALVLPPSVLLLMQQNVASEFHALLDSSFTYT